MKNKKRISLVLICLGVVLMLLVFRNKHVKVVTNNNELIEKTDSLFLELQKRDSQIIIIKTKEDSLLKANTDTLTKIKVIYETKANDIVNLPTDKQVELLSRYLTQDNLNW